MYIPNTKYLKPMMTNITTPDSDDVRQYLIVYVDMPKGENTGPVASEINKFLSNKLNLSNSVLLTKRAVGESVYSQALENLEASALPLNHIHIHKALVNNITNLVNQSRGITWFTELDGAIQHYGSVSEFTKWGIPKFSFYFLRNSYYLQSASMNTKPFVQDGKSVQITINGKKYLMYEYTFNFKPTNDSMPLNLLFGKGKEGYDKTISWLKNHYINQAGWGLPAIDIVYTDEQNQYNIANVRMGIDGNSVNVLAPHINEFDTLTIQPVLDIKDRWIHQTQTQTQRLIYN